MGRLTLSDITPLMNRQAKETLGHLVTYKLANGQVRKLRVQASYEDGTINTGISTGIIQEIEMMVLREDMPSMPSKGDRITTPYRPGDLFQPTNVQSDEGGEHWLFNLKKVAV